MRQNLDHMNGSIRIQIMYKYRFVRFFIIPNQLLKFKYFISNYHHNIQVIKHLKFLSIWWFGTILFQLFFLCFF